MSYCMVLALASFFLDFLARLHDHKLRVVRQWCLTGRMQFTFSVLWDKSAIDWYHPCTHAQNVYIVQHSVSDKRFVFAFYISCWFWAHYQKCQTLIRTLWEDAMIKNLQGSYPCELFSTNEHGLSRAKMSLASKQISGKYYVFSCKLQSAKKDHHIMAN